MKIDIISQNGDKIKDITLEKQIFGIEPNNKVLRDAIVLARASLRQGTHKVKTRAEVSGGGRKPWKQKGTGRARQGSIRSVQWVGGGIAFGPSPRDYSIKQNRKERKLAIKSAYAGLVKDNNLVVVDKIEFTTPKTKEMITVIDKLGLNNVKTLIILNEYSENVILSARNLQKVRVTSVSEVSVLDIAGAAKVIVEVSALEKIMEVLK